MRLNPSHTGADEMTQRAVVCVNCMEITYDRKKQVHGRMVATGMMDEFLCGKTTFSSCLERLSQMGLGKTTLRGGCSAHTRLSHMAQCIGGTVDCVSLCLYCCAGGGGEQGPAGPVGGGGGGG